MPFNRRYFFSLLAAGIGAIASSKLQFRGKPSPTLSEGINAVAAEPLLAQIPFQPLKGAIPLTTNGLSSDQQISSFSTYEVVDDLVLPTEFTYEVIAAWGDEVGDSRFGYNNDYLSFVPTGEGTGYLTINFEYISAILWLQTYEQVIGKSLPFKDVQAAAGGNGLNAYALPEGDNLKTKVQTITKEALVDQGLGVISIRRMADGKWQRVPARSDRRITGISGLEDGRYLKATGPATAVFRKRSGQGYRDKLGDLIIGTFANCAGGTTPWGTVLSAEENFQNQVPEAVYADGTSFSPADRLFIIGEEEISGQGNVFGLAGNKYGWIVEVDPANPKDYGTKHTWLGRYRHEAVGVRVEAGKPLAFYSGCDRRGGHLYKFISRDRVKNPTDKANSQLLENGMLYAAKFNPNGTGRWIPLKPDTPIDPDLTSNLVGGKILLPNRPDGGSFKAETDAEVQEFKQRFKTLGDLYSGNPEEKQGAILIDAHYAANACGATCTARPEDTEIAPDGSLYIAFTSGSPGGEGGPDQRIFHGFKDEVPYEYGFLMQLHEDQNNPAAMTFRWQMLALGGEPADGNTGFANPDNLLIDSQSNLWVVVDMSSDKLNQEISQRVGSNGLPISQSSLRGVLGNNSLWFIPTAGANAGKAFLFGIGPMECELTGPCFSSDQKTLFLSVQHPGEVNGIRQNQAFETRKFAVKTTDGKEFIQTRQVPIGSNWHSKKVNAPPKPAVVAIRRINNQPIVANP